MSALVLPETAACADFLSNSTNCFQVKSAKTARAETLSSQQDRQSMIETISFYVAGSSAKEATNQRPNSAVAETANCFAIPIYLSRNRFKKKEDTLQRRNVEP